MAMGRMKFILFSQQLTSELSPDRSAGLIRVAQFMCAYKYAQAQPLILIFTVCVCVCVTQWAWNYTQPTTKADFYYRQDFKHFAGNKNVGFTHETECATLG